MNMGLAAPHFPPQTFAIILWKYSFPCSLLLPVLQNVLQYMYVPVVKGWKGFYSMKKKDQLQNRNYIEDVKMYRLLALFITLSNGCEMCGSMTV